ncbi:MAG: hypothetical protein HY821_23235 [Acidobacteria bacterium]|nr:hypothetical protein [Acidobacteriota bacterium]
MKKTEMALWMMLAALGSGTAAAGELRVGVAKRVVTPDVKALGKVYIAGYDNNRLATGVHDELYARCMAMSTGGTPLAICGVDVIGIYWDDAQKIRAKVPGAQVVIAATHDHEGPDTMGLWGPSESKTGMDERYMQFLIEQTAEAAREAVANLKPAKVRLARVKTPELDSFIKDNRPPDVHDSDVVLLQALGAGNKPVGTLVNWANHPEALGSKNQLITADYPARLCSELEKLAGGTVVFVNGAVGGMQSPGNAKIKDRKTGQIYDEASFEKADYVGGRVAELAAEALKKGEVLGVD